MNICSDVFFCFDSIFDDTSFIADLEDLCIEEQDSWCYNFSILLSHPLDMGSCLCTKLRSTSFLVVHANVIIKFKVNSVLNTWFDIT